MKLLILKRRKIRRVDEPHDWGHGLILADSGFGKDTLMQRLLEQEFNNLKTGGKKIFTFDIDLLDNVFYSVPQRDPFLLKILTEDFGEKPKGFPSEVICPVFSKEGIKEFKIRVPIDWKLVKLPFKKMTKVALTYWIKKYTEAADQILDALDLQSFDSMSDLVKRINDCASGRDGIVSFDEEHPDTTKTEIGLKQTYQSLSRSLNALAIKDLFREKTEDGFELLDIPKMMEEKRKMTHMTGFFCDGIKNVLNVFFEVNQQIINERKSNPGKYPPMIEGIPEVANYSGNVAENPLVEKFMSKLLQESRHQNMEIYMNTQSPRNITVAMKTNIRKYWLGYMNREDTKYFSDTIHNLRGLRYSKETRDLYSDISRTEKGFFHKLFRNESDQLVWRKTVRVGVPHSHKKARWENVFKTFEEEGKKFKEVVQVFSAKQKVGFASKVGGIDLNERRTGRRRSW